ncbi:hypothetical protein EXIGLDRAFT_772914 [Exidia glandulosa HHB12029]|uniref:PPM-type phosphatase domain-containing protein n=1 Tax=Exidia glandulosa HHB12029 TaxID=1314781 RepID=A0A165F220_EXIGL|nr:hypothetical protein EXIGLDRAFT_772914 [Exidia glandulosa HHB12029]
MRRDQIPGGWPPQQQQRWGPPQPQPADLGRRPSVYGVFRDGSSAGSAAQEAPPAPQRGAKEPMPSLAPRPAEEDARPTTSPVPGHPFLRDGQILVYPISFECHKCLNTGYKNGDPYHPCRGCWDQYAKPYTGALTYAPFSASSSSTHSQISLQRPLPRPSPAPASAPPTLGHVPGAFPLQRQQSVWRSGPAAPPPGSVTILRVAESSSTLAVCYADPWYAALLISFHTKNMIDMDGLEYAVDEAFAFPTRVDASGVRFLLETMPLSCAQKDGVTLHPQFRLLSREESDAALLARKSTDIVTNAGITFSQVSVQSTDVLKPTNEDRAFVHPFVHGTLFGVFDGHNGHEHVSNLSQPRDPFLLSMSSLPVWNT